MNEPTLDKNIKPSKELKTFWANPREKLVAVLFMFFLSFVLTYPSLLGVLAIVQFPMGLVYWYADWKNPTNVPSFVYLIGWVVYFAVSDVIVSARNRKLVIVFFILLAGMLLLNIYGCHVQQSHWQGPG